MDRFARKIWSTDFVIHDQHRESDAMLLLHKTLFALLEYARNTCALQPETSVDKYVTYDHACTRYGMANDISSINISLGIKFACWQCGVDLKTCGGSFEPDQS